MKHIPIALKLVLILPAVLLGACSSSPYRIDSPATSQQRVIDAPRSARGNPSQYEVFGRTYRVMASSDGYRDTGVASWYGRDFHGKSTSSGEPYDMFAFTAAHKSLPIPTWVEVTNQRNGKAIIVKVNDRGPFVDDRIIDLSYAAALELDMVRAGTAPVFVRALGAPATMPVVASLPDSAAVTPIPSVVPRAVSDNRATSLRPEPRVFVQLGAFSELENAVRMAGQLLRAGFSDAAVATQSQDVGTLHRVRLGPLENEDAFNSVHSKLQEAGYSDAQLVVE